VHERKREPKRQRESAYMNMCVHEYVCVCVCRHACVWKGDREYDLYTLSIYPSIHLSKYMYLFIYPFIYNNITREDLFNRVETQFYAYLFSRLPLSLSLVFFCVSFSLYARTTQKQDLIGRGGTKVFARRLPNSKLSHRLLRHHASVCVVCV